MKILQFHGYTQDMGGYKDEIEWLDRINPTTDSLRYAWNELNKSGEYEIQVCSLTKGRVSKSFTQGEIEYIFLPVIFPNLYFHRIGRFSPACFNYIVEKKWNYIIFHYIGGYFNWLLAEYLTKNNISYGIYFHWKENKSRDFIRNFMRKRIIENAAFHIVQTNLQKTFLEGAFNIDQKRIYIVPLGRRTDIFKPFCARKDWKYPRLLMVARIERNKGVLEAVKSLSFLKEYFPEASLEILGKEQEIKYVKEIKKYISQNNLENSIILGGYVDNMKLPEKYNSADLMIFPSISEGLPLVVLESMACGLPVVALKNSGGQEEIIDNNKNGWLVDSESLNETLVMLLKDKDNLRKVGMAGRKKILENYSFGEHYKKHRMLLKKLENQTMEDMV